MRVAIELSDAIGAIEDQTLHRRMANHEPTSLSWLNNAWIGTEPGGTAEHNNSIDAELRPNNGAAAIASRHIDATAVRTKF